MFELVSGAGKESLSLNSRNSCRLELDGPMGRLPVLRVTQSQCVVFFLCVWHPAVLKRDGMWLSLACRRSQVQSLAIDCKPGSGREYQATQTEGPALQKAVSLEQPSLCPASVSTRSIIFMCPEDGSYYHKTCKWIMSEILVWAQHT